MGRRQNVHSAVAGGKLNPLAEEAGREVEDADVDIVAVDAKPLDVATGTYARAILEEWYISWVADRVAEGRIPTTDEEWEAAKSVCGSGVPRSAMRKLRSRHAPESWRLPGRRSRPEADER